MDKKPYKETLLKTNKFVRFFRHDVDPTELKWHQDEETRIVYSLYDTDWKLQIDNEMPQTISSTQTISIKKGTYHRLIKGTNNLYLIVIKF